MVLKEETKELCKHNVSCQIITKGQSNLLKTLRMKQVEIKHPIDIFGKAEDENNFDVI